MEGSYSCRRQWVTVHRTQIIQTSLENVAEGCPVAEGFGQCPDPIERWGPSASLKVSDISFCTQCNPMDSHPVTLDIITQKSVTQTPSSLSDPLHPTQTSSASAGLGTRSFLHLNGRAPFKHTSVTTLVNARRQREGSRERTRKCDIPDYSNLMG